MARTPEDPVREDRITMQIVVDAYGADEQAMGWFCYLENELKFPFEAICIARRSTSALKPNESVTVTSMGDSDECLHAMFVTVDRDESDEDDEDELAVPLSQLMPVDADPKTKEAVEDWHYWAARGYRFG